jgi:hypothetical protein
LRQEKKAIGAKRKEPHQSKKRKHKRQSGAKKELHQKKIIKKEVLASFHVSMLSCIIAYLN